MCVCVCSGGGGGVVYEFCFVLLFLCQCCFIADSEDGDSCEMKENILIFSFLQKLCNLRSC